MTRRRRILVAGAAGVALVIAAYSDASAHFAGLTCDKATGVVTASGSDYGQGGTYRIDGGKAVEFVGGFSVQLPGNVTHTLLVTAPDWADIRDSSAVCVPPATTTTTAPPVVTTTTAPAVTTTTLPATTTTAPPASTTTAPAATTTTAPAVTSTTAPPVVTTTVPPAAPPTTAMLPPDNPGGVIVDTPAPSTTAPSGDLPATGDDHTVELAGASAALAAGIALVLIARRRTTS